MIKILQYIDSQNKDHFGKWFSKLDVQAAAKVATYINRMSNGNFSNTKSIGLGLSECKINYGPSYRVYFGNDGGKLIILLAGGTKKKQQSDINNAKALWKEYKNRKKE